MGPDLSDGQTAMTTQTQHLYLYKVKKRKNTLECEVSVFAEKTESKTFSKLSVTIVNKKEHKGQTPVDMQLS